MKSLYDELKKYSEKGIYSCHMPGHKGRGVGVMPAEYASIDQTEAEGLDDLHDPQGIIKEAESFAGRVLGSDETHFLINGSTAGILAAVLSSVRPGGKLVLCRGCHKSAYNAMQLANIRPGYIFPELLKDPLMEEAANAGDVRKVLDENPDADAVLIVSPTYEGRLSDIRSIADEVHKLQIPLIVDEAHGAHLSFVKNSPSDAIRCGADVVIQSVHKTLPAPTQTALISVKGKLANREKIRRYLSVFQSSSPSYPLMAMIDGCMRYMSENSGELIPSFFRDFEKMTKRLSGCDKLYIRPSSEDLSLGRADYGKLLICTDRSDIDGAILAGILRNEYLTEPEMVTPDHVLLMFTVCDTKAAFDKVSDAVLGIDKKISGAGKKQSVSYEVPRPVQVMSLKDAFEAEYEECELKNAAGRVSTEIICMYPPGSPILAPGEEICEKHILILEEYLARGMNIKGIRDNKVKVVKNG